VFKRQSSSTINRRRFDFEGEANVPLQVEIQSLLFECQSKPFDSRSNGDQTENSYFVNLNYHGGSGSSWMTHHSPFALQSWKVRQNPSFVLFFRLMFNQQRSGHFGGQQEGYVKHFGCDQNVGRFFHNSNTAQKSLKSIGQGGGLTESAQCVQMLLMKRFDADAQIRVVGGVDRQIFGRV
jgi:hypothetical protein